MVCAHGVAVGCGCYRSISTGKHQKLRRATAVLASHVCILYGNDWSDPCCDCGVSKTRTHVTQHLSSNRFNV